MQKPSLALTCLASALTLVHAQEVPIQTLPAVTVTAKGYVADELDTAAATQQLSRDDLLRKGAYTVGDALRGEPGLAVHSEGAHGGNPVLRGLKKESVVSLVDGIRLHAAQPVGAITSLIGLPLAQAVEVLKGPASVLYGSGALGGAVNVRLPQARFVPGLGLDTTMSWDSASQGVRATGLMNAASDAHALMLGVSQARVGDYQSPQGRVARTGYGSDRTIGQYRYRLDASNEVHLSLQQHSDEDVWYPGSTRTHAHPQVQSTTVHSPKQTRQLAALGWNQRGSGPAPLNLDVRAYRQEVAREVFSYANGPLRRDIAQARVAFATDGVEARADWLAAPAHLLSFGASAWQTSASPQRLQPTPATNPTNPLGRSDPYQNGRMDAFGVYAQDDAHFGRLGLMLGLRYDIVAGQADSVGTPPVTENLARRDHMGSGSVAAVYELADMVRPYAHFSRGVRAGDMRERFESALRSDGFYYVGNPQIRPETATQFELGIKGANERWDYRVAVYRNQIDDYLTGQDISGTAQATAACGAANAGACKRTVNLGRATLAGAEAQVRWQFARGQWIGVGASLVRGTNDDLGEPLFQMPADELSLGWEGRITAAWTLDSVLRLVRRQDRVATVFARGTEDETPGFVTADLGATWRQGAHSVRVALKNVADRQYHEHLTEGVSGQETAAPGRSLYLVYSGKF